MEPAVQMSEADAAARAWRAGLPSGRHRSTNLRGCWIFLRSTIVYGLLFWGAFSLPARWMRIACLSVTPFVIGALFVIGHDAAHHSLTPSRWLNRILGRLAMLPAYHPYTSWCYAHNGLHHGGTCLKNKQPDFPPLSKEEFDRLPRWRQRLERIYRSPLGVGLCYTVEFFALYLLFPAKGRRSPHTVALQLDRLVVLGFCGTQLWAAYQLTAYAQGMGLARWLQAVAGVAIPWGVWIYFMGAASFVQHTHPRTAWYNSEEEWSFYHVQLRSSTHMLLPWQLGRILHNIMDHPAHHIDPTIPLYELPATQKALELQTPEHSVVVRLTWHEYRRICRTCKLYDYQRHCWLDFDGRPTTETGLHRLASLEGSTPG